MSGDLDLYKAALDSSLNEHATTTSDLDSLRATLRQKEAALASAERRGFVATALLFGLVGAWVYQWWHNNAKEEDDAQASSTTK